MTKSALITGGTDGIGRGAALALARRGYVIHILGRNIAKGKGVLAEVEAVLPGVGHKFYHADLSTMTANRAFLAQYKAEHDQLNLLVHSANALTKNVALNDEGVAVPFFLGAISRYLLSVELDDLLMESGEARVMHLGMVTLLPKAIDYDAMRCKEVDIAKASTASFLGSALMVRYFGEDGQVKARHELQDPGVVNTQQVRAAPWYYRLIFKFMNPISAEAEGEIVAERLTGEDAGMAGSFFKRGTRVRAPGLVENTREWDRFKGECGGVISMPGV